MTRQCIRGMRIRAKTAEEVGMLYQQACCEVARLKQENAVLQRRLSAARRMVVGDASVCVSHSGVTIPDACGIDAGLCSSSLDYGPAGAEGGHSSPMSSPSEPQFTRDTGTAGHGATGQALSPPPLTDVFLHRQETSTFRSDTNNARIKEATAVINDLCRDVAVLQARVTCSAQNGAAVQGTLEWAYNGVRDGLCTAEDACWQAKLDAFRRRSTILEYEARRAAAPQRKGVKERLTAHGMWWTAREFRSHYGCLGPKWRYSKPRARRWTQRGADAQEAASTQSEQVSAASEKCGGTSVAAVERTQRSEAHKCLLIDNICFWVATFVHRDWARTCSSAARMVGKVTYLSKEGWLSIVRELGHWQSRGRESSFDTDCFGPDPGPMHAARLAMIDLKAEVGFMPPRSDSVNWSNRWLLYIMMAANLYEDMQLRNKELFLEARVTAMALIRTVDHLSETLKMYDRRKAAEEGQPGDGD